MKNFLLSFFVILSITSFTQTKYIITLNTSNNLKDAIEYISGDYETYDRYIIDSITVTFSSNINISDEYFYNVSNEQISIINVEHDSTEFKYSTKTSPGGVDCESASIVCTNDSFNGTATGFGTQELSGVNNGCLNGNEHQSSWYYINIGTGGPLTMTINPDNGSDDYDFAIWGPFTTANAGANCPPINNPIRCSYAAGSGVNTGLVDLPSNQASEGAFGDGWVEQLNTNPGEIYIMIIDNFSSSGDPYSVMWGGTAGLDCTPVILPIELVEFEGKADDEVNKIHWITTSEINNDHFTLDKSEDGIYWHELAVISGAGNSNIPILYEYIDEKPNVITTYYRLKQTDYDGNFTYHDIISVDNESGLFYVYLKYDDNNIYLSSPENFKLYNMMGQVVIYGNGSKIEADKLPQGIYILKIGSYTQKFFIR